MRLFGLIGHPLSHSFSGTYFAKKFLLDDVKDAEYRLFDLEETARYPALLKAHANLCGLNVTIPYKTSIIPYIDELDEMSAAINAVNTIKILPHKTIGYNTDVIGFELALKKFIGGERLSALILGTGGASKAVEFVLKKMNIPHLVISRNQGIDVLSYGQLTANMLREHCLLINCTPLGKFPDVNLKPALPYNALSKNHFLFDLNYNPAETAFLQEGMAVKAKVQNGLSMLHLQADAAWEIWNSPEYL
jgi:shikimate dehydrogenase